MHPAQRDPSPPATGDPASGVPADPAGDAPDAPDAAEVAEVAGALDVPDVPRASDARGAGGDLVGADVVGVGEVGVGPWVGPLPDDPRYDPELLAAGDRRNVVDRYRYWRMEAVVADLDRRRHPFHVAIENWQHDLNIGSVVRTANAFLAREVHVVGRRKWNRRGAMVTDRYQHVRYHPELADLARYAAEEGLPVIGVDNLPGSVPLETYELPEACVLLFGQEGPGLTDAAHAVCTEVLNIGQYGSTRSINASAAAAIAMHAWVRRHTFDQHPNP